MGFETIKQDFPKMPQEMKDMIKKEVDRQLQAEQPKPKSRKTMRRAVALALAAVMLCGVTAFAAGIYRLQKEQIGEHGVSITISGSDSTEETAPDDKPLTIPNVRLETGYLPEGMVQTEQTKYSFEDALCQGGISMAFYRMDTGDDQFRIEHGDVVSSEEFTVNGYQGIYLEYPHPYPDEIAFNQRIYIAYTDVHYVMEMYAASDVSKEEALKIAEHVKLIPTEDTEGEDLVVAQNWSGFRQDAERSSEEEPWETVTSVSEDEMKHTHNIGDSFPLDEQGLSVKISEVNITDDLSPLDPAQIGEDLKKETDGSGKLLPATIRYVKDGDLDSLSQEVSSRQAAQKLVCATVEYTNTGSEERKDTLFFGYLMRIHETDGQMQIASEEQPSSGDEWERAVTHGLSDFREMLYYDIHGGERGNNYIPSIQPGETVTVHMAWVVTEEELGDLYVCLDPSGSAYEFIDSSLEIGYVDIRQ